MLWRRAREGSVRTPEIVVLFGSLLFVWYGGFARGIFFLDKIVCFPFLHGRNYYDFFYILMYQYVQKLCLVYVCLQQFLEKIEKGNIITEDT